MKNDDQNRDSYIFFMKLDMLVDLLAVIKATRKITVTVTRSDFHMLNHTSC